MILQNIATFILILSKMGNCSICTMLSCPKGHYLNFKEFKQCHLTLDGYPNSTSINLTFKIELSTNHNFTLTRHNIKKKNRNDVNSSTINLKTSMPRNFFLFPFFFLRKICYLSPYFINFS